MSASMQASRRPSDNLHVKMTKRCDTTLIISVMLLLGIGLVMVASSSIEIAEKMTGDPLYYFKRQFIFVLLGVSAGFVLTRIRLMHWESVSALLLFLMVALLGLVLIPGLGKTVNGSTRWLALGSFGFQVSEVVKLLLIIYLAGYAVRQEKQIRDSFIGLLKPMFVIGMLLVLLLLEPDFGAAIVLLAIALGMFYLAGVSIWKFGILILACVPFMALVAVSSPYRVERFTSFLNPWLDPYGSGFQLTQSLIAIGSGSWTGLGLGASVQKLFYLPEAHTDFVFAVIAEELGLLGIVVILALFIALIYRCFAIGRLAEIRGTRFGAQVCYGTGIWLGLQAFVNIGVNMGILPTKGLTLPLISAGGSSLLAVCMAIGLVVRVYIESVEESPMR